MLYLCCTKLSFTTVNPLFIGYSVAIYDKPMSANMLKKSHNVATIENT